MSLTSAAVDPGVTIVQNNATLTATGSQIITGVAGREVTVGIVIRGTVSGTTPSLTVTLAEIDPVDGTTVHSLPGNTVSVGPYTTTSHTDYNFMISCTGAVRVTWTITGTSPSFGGVDIWVAAKTQMTFAMGVTGGLIQSPLSAVLTDAASRSVMVGPSTVGAAVAGAPVLNGASDGTNAQYLRSTSTSPAGTEQGLIVKPVTNQRATYSAGIDNLVPAATPTDIFTITGSATKTVRILRIEITATATASAAISLLLVKRSTANTVGTKTNPASIPHNSGSAAATATIAAYTANPTLGTIVGSFVRSTKLFASTVATQPQTLIWDWANRVGQEPTLIGTAQVLALNLNGATLTGGSVNVSVEFVEE